MLDYQERRKRVLLELLILQGRSKEYRKQVCHAGNVRMVRDHLAKNGRVIGSLVSDLDE